VGWYFLNFGFPMVESKEGSFRCRSGKVGSQLAGLFLPQAVRPGFQAWSLAGFCLGREDFWKSEVGAVEVGAAVFFLELIGWRTGGILEVQQ
jgi:hypothetical protein